MIRHKIIKQVLIKAMNNIKAFINAIHAEGSFNFNAVHWPQVCALHQRNSALL